MSSFQNKESKPKRSNVFHLAWEKLRLKEVQTYLGVFLAFCVPIAILFFLDPDSFQLLWKGRTFYLFFLWFIILEVVLSWEDFQFKTFDSLKSTRTLVLAVALLFPTIYVIIANYFGLNEAILSLAIQINVPWANDMPLSIEYLVFMALFVIITMFAYGVDGLKGFSISAFLLGTVGTLYLIDSLYPYGRFAPLQALVPSTAILAASALNFMGYQTSLSIIENHPKYGSLPYLEVENSAGEAGFGIAWPCSGVQSLLLYTFTILFFLKKTNIPWMQKIIYFAIGALVTYFINILRIASIFIIAVNGGDVEMFHNYYGELYSMTWIIAYPLIIIGSRMLWTKMKLRLTSRNFADKSFISPSSI